MSKSSAFQRRSPHVASRGGCLVRVGVFAHVALRQLRGRSANETYPRVKILVGLVLFFYATSSKIVLFRRYSREFVVRDTRSNLASVRRVGIARLSPARLHRAPHLALLVQRNDARASGRPRKTRPREFGCALTNACILAFEG